MTVKLTVPDWSQSALIKAAGLELICPVITLDNDRLLCVKDLKSGQEYIINKRDGETIMH